MLNGNSQFKEPIAATEAGSQSQASPERINAAGLANFTSWIDSELNAMLASRTDWQTAQSNRKYFDR